MVLAHTGSPGQRTVKWVCVYNAVYKYMYLFSLTSSRIGLLLMPELDVVISVN